MLYPPPHIVKFICVAAVFAAGILVGKWLLIGRQDKQNPSHTCTAAAIKFCPNCGAKIEQAGG